MWRHKWEGRIHTRHSAREIQNTFIACLQLASNVFFELCLPFTHTHTHTGFKDSLLRVSRPWWLHTDHDNVLRFPRVWLTVSILR